MLKNSRSLVLILLLACLTLSGCSSLFYYPDRMVYFEPTRNGFYPDEIIFKAGDGTKLMGWFFPAKNPGKIPQPGPLPRPRGTIILFHGNAQNLSAHYASLVWLTEQGWNLFIFSYRGYGKSEGSPTQPGTVLDGIAALNQGLVLHEAHGGGKLVAWGQSLGGAVIARSMDESVIKDRFDLLVLDSTFSSYRDIAQSKLAEHWITWPLSWLGRVLVSNQESSVDSIKRNRLPLLVIHDKHDPVCPYEGGVEIFNLAHDPKWMWTYDQGYHVGAFARPGSDARTRLVQFLNQLPTHELPTD